jgi:hypothetical protein
MFDEELEAKHEEIAIINKLIQLLNDFISIETDDLVLIRQH